MRGRYVHGDTEQGLGESLFRVDPLLSLNFLRTSVAEGKVFLGVRRKPPYYTFDQSRVLGGDSSPRSVHPD